MHSTAVKGRVVAATKPGSPATPAAGTGTRAAATASRMAAEGRNASMRMCGAVPSMVFTASHAASSSGTQSHKSATDSRFSKSAAEIS